jgi:hypothetical protein
MSDDPVDDSSRRARHAECRRMNLHRLQIVEVRCMEAALVARRTEELRQDRLREQDERPERVLQ